MSIPEKQLVDVIAKLITHLKKKKLSPRTLAGEINSALVLSGPAIRGG